MNDETATAMLLHYWPRLSQNLGQLGVMVEQLQFAVKEHVSTEQIEARLKSIVATLKVGTPKPNDIRSAMMELVTAERAQRNPVRTRVQVADPEGPPPPWRRVGMTLPEFIAHDRQQAEDVLFEYLGLDKAAAVLEVFDTGKMSRSDPANALQVGFEVACTVGPLADQLARLGNGPFQSGGAR